MKKNTIHISLWLGTCKKGATLKRAVRNAYNNDGDSLGSAFGRGFNLNHDDDHIEAFRANKKPNSLPDLLQGISYDEYAIPAINRLKAKLEDTENCFVCIYEYQHKGKEGQCWTTGDLSLRFVGTTSFEAPKIDVSQWMAPE